MAIIGGSIAGRRRAACLIYVDGRDVTDRFDPYLISVQAIDRYSMDDECHLELDDTDGVLEIPQNGQVVQVYLGWSGIGPRTPTFRIPGPNPSSIYDVIPTVETNVTRGEMPWEETGLRLVFQGEIKSIESGFSRRAGGRRLWIEASSLSDYGSKAKQVHQMSWGDGSMAGATTLGDVVKEAGKKVGIDVTVDPKIAAMKRNFFYMNDSFQNLMSRIAREVGGRAKFSGNTATLNGPDGTNAFGQTMPTVEAIWGINLISWRIKPYATRPQYAKAHRRFFDEVDSVWKGVLQEITTKLPFGQVPSQLGSPHTSPRAITGSQQNDGGNMDVKDKQGTGYVVINGEPIAFAGGFCVVSGARQGVDGNYGIKEREHNYTRAGGFITRLSLERPDLPFYVQQAIERAGGDMSKVKSGAVPQAPPGSYVEPERVTPKVERQDLPGTVPQEEQYVPGQAGEDVTPG